MSKPVDIVARLEDLMKQGEDYIWRPAAEAATEIRQLRREVARLEEVNAKLVEAATELLRHDGGEGSKGYHAIKSYDARERLRAALAAAKEQQQ